MDKVYFIAVIFASTLFLFSPGTVLSQQEERLAVVSEYEGDVRVEHESILKTVKKIGNRIRNSAVYEDGSVMTMHASTADLVFNDNTSLQIDENTSLTIGTREVSGEEKAEGGFIRQVSGKQSEIVRNIYVKAGKFLANITPSKSVLTEFETPTGVAAVRGTMFTLAYVGGVTSIDLTEGLVNFASAGDDVSFSIEPGDSMDISIPELGHTSVGVNTGQIDVATDTGTLIIESGESTGVEVDTDTGEVTVTAEEGTVDFETSTGTAVIEEGEAAGTSVDADTGEVTISSEEGSVVFETAMGNVMMDEGDTMGSRMDAETGDMIMTAEEGTIEFETAMGNVTMDEGDAMGSHMDAETGDMIMTAEEGTIEFETAMGNAVLQEGAVLEVAFDDNTGEMSLSSGGGTSTLETDNGTITMDEGGSMNFTVNDNTGEITVIGTTGDITMTNEDGTTMTLEGGTNMGIMQDDGNEGPMEPGPGPDDGHHDLLPNISDGQGEGTYTEGVYEGTMTVESVDGQGVFDGTYTEATGVYEGTMTDDSGTYAGTYTEGNNTFAGTYTDTAGNTYNYTDYQQSSYNADESTADDSSSGTSLTFVVDPTSDKTINWSNNRQNVVTVDDIGITAPTTPNTNTGDFEEHFGSAANFALIHTGFDTLSNGLLEWEFNVDPFETRQFSFDYNFIKDTTNTQNDTFKALLIDTDGNETILRQESVNGSTFHVDSFLFDADLGVLKSGSSGHQTGWQTFDDNITFGSVGGEVILRFKVTDNAGSTDTGVLLDNIVDPPVVASSTDYLLTFARMLRGEIDVHDADLEADTVASAEHQAFVAKVNEVISDIENSSNSELVTGTDVFLDRLVDARGIITDHEDNTGFLQQTGVAHHLLEASIMTDRGIGTNIAAIKDSINQAKAFLVAHVNDFGETDALASIKTNIDSVLANIENVNNNEFTTATLVAIRDGIKQVFSDTIDHMNNNGCNNSEHPECDQHVL